VQTDVETNLPFEHARSAVGVMTFLVVLVACMTFATTPAARAADESVLLEKPPTKSVEEDLDPLDRAFVDERRWCIDRDEASDQRFRDFL
jgi:hypothetical protein